MVVAFEDEDEDEDENEDGISHRLAMHDICHLDSSGNDSLARPCRLHIPSRYIDPSESYNSSSSALCDVLFLVKRRLVDNRIMLRFFA